MQNLELINVTNNEDDRPSKSIHWVGDFCGVSIERMAKLFGKAGTESGYDGEVQYWFKGGDTHINVYRSHSCDVGEWLIGGVDEEECEPLISALTERVESSEFADRPIAVISNGDLSPLIDYVNAKERGETDLPREDVSYFERRITKLLSDDPTGNIRTLLLEEVCRRWKANLD